MHHIEFQPSSTYNIALLIKSADLNELHLRHHYVDYLVNNGVRESDIIAWDLEYDVINNKAPAIMQKAYLDKLLNAVNSQGVTTLFVCDANYFKTLTKEKKTEPHFGYVLPCAIKGYEHMNVVLGLNYKALMFDPSKTKKLTLALDTIVSNASGIHIPIGTNIVHSAEYFSTTAELRDIDRAIDKLHQYDELTCDIEAFSLMFNNAGIGTIAFAWNEHNGIAIACDHCANDMDAIDMFDRYAIFYKNIQVRELLKKFFETYKGKLIYHNANYDIKVLIYTLWMNSTLDQKGLLEGLEVMTKCIDDTKLISYLATNATVGNDLKLKSLAHEFAGNYAVDVKDIGMVPQPELLKYNLIDCLSTWYVYKKCFPVMVKDSQLGIYTEVFLPSVKMILQMELSGAPLDMDKVVFTRAKLEKQKALDETILKSSGLIQQYELKLRKEEWTKKNLLLKVKVKPLSDFDDIVFNPRSDKQLQGLIYDFLGYAVIDSTKGGAPATGAKTIAKIKLISTDPKHTVIFDALIGLAKVSIILDTFINAFITKSIEKNDGRWYLHGNFNIGGTISGRLSSSKPNMQNIPSTGSTYSKDIKECFKAPPGWVFIGADFASLEDKISALTTKDPNKIKVYTDGYDGHCLRAYSYFGDQMADIGNTVSEINSIAQRYPALRQASKAPTFLLTYGGTAHGLVSTVGLRAVEADLIEMNYHHLYKVSDKWVKDKMDQASIDGYVTVAFGMRLRTPALALTLHNKSSTPYQAKAEARTAGNALGQSYGMLNNRAAIEFQQRCLASDYAMKIKPIMHVHDSQYFLVRDEIGAIEWFNKNLIECMEWQNLPELQHPTIKLGGDVDVFHPTWADSISIPKNASRQDIADIGAKA